MNNKGEFEKRIEDLSDSYYEIITTVPAKDMKEIVDEARKDFPSGWIEAHASEIFEWFEKWFGEVEE